MGEPHSSQVVFSISETSTTSSSGSGMLSVYVQFGYPLQATKRPFLPMRSLSFLPHCGHFSSIAGTTESFSFFAWASGMLAGWNTFAQIHNTISAIRSVPPILSSLGKFFKNDKKGGVFVILAVLL